MHILDKKFLLVVLICSPTMNGAMIDGNFTDNTSGKLILGDSTGYSGSPFYAILSIEIVAAVVSNSLFLLSFIKATECSGNMYMTLQSISVVDIFASLSAMTHCLISYIDDFTILVEVCRYFLICNVALLMCNSFHILLMAIDRHIAISKPHR